MSCKIASVRTRYPLILESLCFGNNFTLEQAKIFCLFLEPSDPRQVDIVSTHNTCLINVGCDKSKLATTLSAGLVQIGTQIASQ